MSDTGDLLATGMSDSTIKVFWLNKQSLVRSIGMGDCNPFADQDPAQVINQPFTVMTQVGMRMQMYADQYEAAN